VTEKHIGIVGAGIVGLAHAWSAAERGFRVTVLERSARASGASIRNFGMVWPIGQPPGELYETAMLSRARWLRLEREARLWVNPCGSIHLAHRSDEWEVLEQFHEQAESLGIACELLTAAEVQRRTPAANPDGLLGGLYSPTELCVNPREATRGMPAWLQERFGIEFRFETHVASIHSQDSPTQDGSMHGGVHVITARGESLKFEQVIVCCGAEMQSLFPDVLRESGLRRCKLQMMSVRRPSSDWTLGPHLASGLTLRHYRNFEVCSALAALKTRVAEETPELDRFGIHVMASQNNHGDIILGDSHEYGDDIEPFDTHLIDQLMLRELGKIIRLPDWTLLEHWHGVYAKHPHKVVFEANPQPGVYLCTGTGGAGMTMSFGLAERMWKSWTAVP
jgi:FAD dependent oxidoreductase TIGR03364